MLKYIFFDIDDTLFPSTEFAKRARRNAVRAMVGLGLPHSEKQLTESLMKIIKGKGSNYPKHFDVLLEEYNVKKPARYIAAAVAAYHDTKTSIQPFPDALRTLLKLKEKGYRLCIATNGRSLKQWDKLIRLGIVLYFDEVFVSETEGVEKSKAFFRKVFGKLKAKPSECLMVGDREDADIIPAKNAGMHTVKALYGKEGKPTKADFGIRKLSSLLTIVERL